VNATSAGPFMVRNQFSDGQFIEQGKRLQFSAGLRPTLFGFFPGLGPLARIRHSISPIIDFFYAPAARVDPAYSRAIDPAFGTGSDTILNAGSDPQATISIGLSQNIEGKLRPAPNDTGQHEPRKVRLLSLNTDAMQYNFEQAKELGRTGWQTQTIGNTFASDLLPNFSLRLVHDLWDGPVGLQGSNFSPFLTSVNASFAVSPATLRGIARLLGFHPGQPPPTAPPPAPGTTPGGAPLTPGAPPGGLGLPPVPLPPIAGAPLFGGPSSGLAPGAPGQGFSLTVSYSSNRVRPLKSDTLAPVGIAPIISPSQEQLNLNLSFQPTPKWQANWTTSYDLITRQFSEHLVRLERDLHRWHASFAFAKSANGNFAFTFYVSLLDEPDIKFNYEQQTLQQ
jgi:hypothetical protein